MGKIQGQLLQYKNRSKLFEATMLLNDDFASVEKIMKRLEK
jgi:hypothetical protein